MKGVLLFCLMNVHVDKKTSNFFILCLIIVIFCLPWSMKINKNIKI
jgi:hypothetical protein